MRVCSSTTGFSEINGFILLLVALAGRVFTVFLVATWRAQVRVRTTWQVPGVAARYPDCQVRKRLYCCVGRSYHGYPTVWTRGIHGNAIVVVDRRSTGGCICCFQWWDQQVTILTIWGGWEHINLAEHQPMKPAIGGWLHHMPKAFPSAFRSTKPCQWHWVSTYQWQSSEVVLVHLPWRAASATLTGSQTAAFYQYCVLWS
jgi:hypothetical protein